MATTYTVHAGVHNCGHNHKSVEAATKCGDKLYDSHYVGKFGQRVRHGGTWTASAKWHGWRVIDNSSGQSVPEVRR